MQLIDRRGDSLRRSVAAVARRYHRREGERGQMALFILGAMVIALTLILGVADVTAVQLARVRMYDVCDAAALDAADEVAAEVVYKDGVGASVPVSNETVQKRADLHLSRSERPANVTAWNIAPGTGTKDQRSATVVLTGTVRPPLAPQLISAITGDIQLTVSSTAIAQVKR